MLAGDASSDNHYLRSSIPVVFLKTALPIVLLMIVNGLFNIVDAYFLGIYVSETALTAVTLMFPLQMVILSVSMMVSTGMSSILARRLGAGDQQEAAQVFGHAHIVAIGLGIGLLLVFLLIGSQGVGRLVNDAAILYIPAYTYISLMVFSAPLMFLVSIQIDGLRCEGRMQAMLSFTLLSALANIVLDYLFIAEFGWGVAGSAWATIAAMAVTLFGVLYIRHKGQLKLKAALTIGDNFGKNLREILALGIPASLTQFGVAVSAIITIYALQIWPEDRYEIAAGGFGLVTRITTFVYLPLMGLSLAFQAILGNNYGAGKRARTNQTLKVGMIAAFAYCVAIQFLLINYAGDMVAVFVDSPNLINMSARILAVMAIMFGFFGPQLIITNYFQAKGEAKMMAILSLARVYVFLVPLTFALPPILGQDGIWLSRPVTEVCIWLVTFYMLYQNARNRGLKYGLFYKLDEEK